MEKYLTSEGFEKLNNELKYLKEVKRKEISERLERALAFGDLNENAEYNETKEAQAFVEGRILELEDIMQNAVIVPSENKSDFVQIGSTILVSSGVKKEEFKLVGAEEANPLEGKISIISPLGQAILNKQKGTTVEVNTPRGKIEYKILKIE